VHLKRTLTAWAQAGGSWMTFYNFRRPHQAMNNQMPMVAWRAGMDKSAAQELWICPSLGQRKRCPIPQHKHKQQKRRF
jgi:hypothetical protein